MTSAHEITDHLGLEVLTADECWTLVRGVPIGRIAYVDAGEPVVLPITHSVDGHHVVFRSAHGTKLWAVESGHPVAFEADSWDAAARTGWSVLVRGTAETVLDDEEIARLGRDAAEAWLPEAQHGTWVRLTPTEVTGRRLA